MNRERKIQENGLRGNQFIDIFGAENLTGKMMFYQCQLFVANESERIDFIDFVNELMMASKKFVTKVSGLNNDHSSDVWLNPIHQ